jgi:hypothetical protein
MIMCWVNLPETKTDRLKFKMDLIQVLLIKAVEGAKKTAYVTLCQQHSALSN